MSLASNVTLPSVVRSELELVAAVRAGNDRAFEELYSRYRSRIGSYIFGLVGDYARAEDLSQEVFISALRRMRDTERPIAFKPWIYEIAKNACIDEFRRTRRSREVPLSAGEDEDSADVLELRSTSATPDAAIECKQSLDDLRGAFRGLSENHHKVIVMREFAGMSYDQIGERLGMSRPVVESTLFRARRRLSVEYDELVSGRRCEQVQHVIDNSPEKALRRIGARERRLLAQHLSHCQPCRRHARLAGVDESLFRAPPTVIGKIAALFPWLRSLRARRGARDPGSSGGADPASLTALRSLQTAATLAPVASSAGVGRTVAAVAAIAVAGAGVGGGVMASGSSNRSAATALPPALRSGPTAAKRPPRAAFASGRSTSAVTASSRTTTPPSKSFSGSPAGRSTRTGGAASSTSGTTASPSGHSGASSSTPGGTVSKALSGTGGTVSKVVGGAGGTVSKVVGGAGGTVSKVVGGTGSIVSGAAGAASAASQATGVSVPSSSRVISKVTTSVPAVPSITVPLPPGTPDPGKLLGH
jgi:RNA polymerase sigma factor (sigma-70 family)